MKALIIGGGGFVGRYLAAECLRQGWDTTVTKLPSETVTAENCTVCDLDILDFDAVKSLLAKLRPERIFHLAAQSSVAVSWKKPQLTADINIHGSLNVLETVRSLADYAPRMLLIGSGEEYGALPAGVSRVDENVPVHPGNPYAITKAAQNQFGTLYAKAYHMEVVLVRAFNHVGPGQTPQFVVSDFCKQAAEIAGGLREPVMRVGNLSAARDFTDVRDVVRAYVMLAQQGKAGETYNVGSGHAIVIEQLLKEIIRQSGAEIRVETDPAKLRPVELPVVEADIAKLQRDTGWKPEIPLSQTIGETLSYWKSQGKVGV